MTLRRMTLAAAAVLAGCTSALPIRWAAPTDFDLTVADNPAQQRFDLVLA